MGVTRSKKPDADRNPDPITGAPGAHPVGVGVGAASAGAAGAAIGSVAGPVGTVVGAVAGAVVGGLAGKGVAEQLDPTVEDQHWRKSFADRPYVEQGRDYDYYQPAYRYGWESRSRLAGRRFEDVEPELERGWTHARGKSNLSWDKAKDATRDAWHRIERAIPGDADGDGR